VQNGRIPDSHQENGTSRMSEKSLHRRRNCSIVYSLLMQTTEAGQGDA
jgi:hypothetical protein